MAVLIKEDPKSTNLPVVLVIVGLVEMLINGCFLFVLDELSTVTVLWSLHGVVVGFYGVYLVFEKRRNGQIGGFQIWLGRALLWLIVAVLGYFLYSIRGITSLG